ncbi:MAG: tyrosine-type recombinase/integrase [Beijerinckiaceae bacterium]
MPSEKLPTGFTRRPSGSLRVQIRLKGHEPVIKNFPLVSTEASERRRQLAEAAAWATETRRRMLAGSHVSSREAELTSLAEALRRYEAEGMSGSEENQKVDRYRIKRILDDPIAQRPLAHISSRDVAAFRDRLIKAGWLKSVNACLRKLAKQKASRTRIAEVKGLVRRREKTEATEKPGVRRRLEAEIAIIEKREGIKSPARSTIVNITQLISRALKHASETMDAIPEIRGVSMPKASPGRERRVSPAEMDRLLETAYVIDPVLPLLIRFAVTTTLRRGRLLSCQLSDIRDIGGGKRAIAFPRSTAERNKRTGVIPVTSELQAIISEACALRGLDPRSNADEKVFCVSASQLVSWWDRLLNACAITDLHWHDLRHEGTSRLFERGLSTAEVMSITGHSTQEMVDRYSHYSAALVHNKLERGTDVEALLAEVQFLLTQYLAAGGDMERFWASRPRGVAKQGRRI